MKMSRKVLRVDVEINGTREDHHIQYLKLSEAHFISQIARHYQGHGTVKVTCVEVPTGWYKSQFG